MRNDYLGPYISRGSQLTKDGIPYIPIDVKRAYGVSTVLNALVDDLYDLFQESSPGVTCVAATGLGGIPLATLISVKYEPTLTMVRLGEMEAYGHNPLIVGYQPTENDKVAVVDDLFFTGRTMHHVINALTGIRIAGVYVVVKHGDREPPWGDTIPLHYLFTENQLTST